jgi:hypothetical protein
LPTTVYNTEEIELMDGSTLTLRPLTIRNRRKFMDAFDTLANRQVNEGEDRTPEDSEDDLLKLIPYCVTGQRPEWEGVFSRNDEEVEAALDVMAGALDEETVFYIIKQTTGVDLKAMAARAEKFLEAGLLENKS